MYYSFFFGLLSLLAVTTTLVSSEQENEDTTAITVDTMFKTIQSQAKLAKHHHHHDDGWDSFPMEENAWVGSRQGLMTELSSLLDVIAEDNDPALLQTALRAHLEHCKSHFEQNQAVLVPKFQERFEYPQEPDESRDKRNDHLNTLDSVADDLTAGKSPPEKVIDALVIELNAYNTTLSEQIQTLEEAFLPLVKEHFSPKDLQDAERDFFTKGSKLMMGSFIYNMGESEFRGDYMKRLGVPFFVWRMAFKPSFTAFCDQFVKPIEGLKK